ncbi:MAG: tRNA-guanine transglycosylase, partial [Chloroflexota bacterium]
GGASHELRRRCAQELLEMGFDGYGYGGWPLTSGGDLLEDALAFTRELVPRQFPLHALGVGHPHNVARAAALGYELFDSALPTRDARQGRLCALKYTPRERDLLAGRDWFHYVYARDAKHSKARGGVYEGCACYTCTHYSLGYLHHLLVSGDGLFARLASIHNLTFMSQLMGWLRTALPSSAIAQSEAVASPDGTAQPDSPAQSDSMGQPDSAGQLHDALPSAYAEAAALAAAALATAKYRHLAPGLAQSIAADLVRQQAGQSAVKAVRSKLHQVACSFQRGKPTYDAWLAQLRAADSPEGLRAACRAIMAHHASTFERLPELDRFYDLLLPERASIRTVLDAGCGFHPLGLQLMNLAPGACYIAFDVLADLVKFLNHCWPLFEVDGRAEVMDLARQPEAMAQPADVAFLLKLLPTLEQIRFGAGADALAACRAPILVVSFPARSLGGRQGGLARPYERWFLAQPLVAGAQLDRFELPSELVYVLRR